MRSEFTSTVNLSEASILGAYAFRRWKISVQLRFLGLVLPALLVASSFLRDVRSRSGACMEVTRAIFPHVQRCQTLFNVHRVMQGAYALIEQ